MTRRRFGTWFVTLIITGLMVGGVGLYQLWRTSLETLGVQALDWRGLTLHRSGLAVEQFDLEQVKSGHRVIAQGQGLLINWTWQGWQPRMKTLTIDQLQVTVNTSGQPESEEPEPSIPTLPTSAPDWLPQTINLRQVDASLPCASGQCPLSGRLSASRGEALFPLQLQLSLNHDSHKVEADATIDRTASDRIDLIADLKVDAVRTLHLETDFSRDRTTAVRHWAGTVHLPHLPQTDWLRDWLQPWYPDPMPELPSQPEAASLNAQWGLDWSASTGLLQQASGSLAFQAHLPDPWPLPGIGTLQGKIDASLAVSAGKWRGEAVRADLQMTEPADWTNALPHALRPDSLRLKLRPAESLPGGNTQSDLLPIQLSLSSAGAAQIDVDGHLGLATGAPWQVQFGPTRVRARLPDTSVGTWQLQRPRLDLTVTGQANQTTLSLTTSEKAIVRADRLQNSEAENTITADTLRADLPSFSLKADYSLAQKALNSVTAQGPIWMSVAKLSHSRLKPQSWQFTGPLTVNLDQLDLAGQLNAKAGASARIQLNYPFDQTLQLDADSTITGKTGSDAWADTLNAWPAVLELSSGSVTGSTSITVPAGKNATVIGDVEFNSLSGTYNRTAWKELDGQLHLTLKDGQFHTEFPALTLKSINPGVNIGPVRLGGDYEAPMGKLASGSLSLTQAEADVLGGQVSVPPAQKSLNAYPIRLPFQIEKLDLAKLMALYPSEGLSGTGTLSGMVPVLIEPDGVIVEQGAIGALKPGGRLQLPGDRLKAMAQDNAAMGIVADAMKNFHYSVLDSTIDYARDGTLALGLHIEGNNPDVQNGQPVVLNINLEEDIPALLTSLQLSGRVNDTVTERVKELIEKQQSNTATD